MAAHTPTEASVSVVPPTSAAAFSAAASDASLPISSSYPIAIPSNILTVSNTDNSGPGLAPKRQRRPSVRLGEIGHQSLDQTCTTQSRRPKNAYRFHKDASLAAKTSKTRPLTNLVGVGDASNDNRDDDNNCYLNPWRRKPATTKQSTKRARTNWGSSALKHEAAASNGGWVVENDTALRGDNRDNHDNDDFQGAEAKASESKEQSPVQSEDNQNMGLRFWDRRATRARGSRSDSLDRQENNHINNNRNNAPDGIQDINSGEENRSSSSVGD